MRRKHPIGHWCNWWVGGWAALLAGLTAVGCVSKSAALRQRQQAFQEGREKAVAEQLLEQQPYVVFRGDVQNPRVPWREGLTLAEALLAAHYTWSWDPHVITLTRDGQVYSINPRHFLRGSENPELQTGDLIDVHH